MRPILIDKNIQDDPTPHRRRWLLGLAALTVGGPTGLIACAHGPQAAGPADRLLDLRSGREIDVPTLLEQARASRFVLLGELHDNPHHHARRAELLGRLATPGTVVVAEHLTRGRQAGADGDLLAALQAAGFDPRGWQWPLHQPLFAALRQAGLPLWGGNLPAAEARRIAREGEPALPAELAAPLAAAPLTESAQARLDAHLQAGHCGQLPAARLPAMRLAQRARDAAMALALRDSGGRPAVLLAGNGHVRRDYGVAQLLARLEPQAPCIQVAFGEHGDEPEGDFATHLWTTAAPSRSDPCAGFDTMRRPAEPERSRAR